MHPSRVHDGHSNKRHDSNANQEVTDGQVQDQDRCHCMEGLGSCHNNDDKNIACTKTHYRDSNPEVRGHIDWTLTSQWLKSIVWLMDLTSQFRNNPKPWKHNSASLIRKKKFKNVSHVFQIIIYIWDTESFLLQWQKDLWTNPFYS